MERVAFQNTLGNGDPVIQNFQDRIEQQRSTATTGAQPEIVEAVETPQGGMVGQNAANVPYGQSSWERTWRQRERARQARIFMFHTEILRRLGFEEQPDTDARDMVSEEQRVQLEQVMADESSHIDMGSDVNETDTYYAKKLMSYVSSCSLPHRADDCWRDDNESELKLYFQPDLHDESHQLRSATLRIYKIPLDEESLNAERRESRHISEVIETGHVDVPELNPDNLTGHDVIITVHKFTKPLKKDRKARYELVSRTIVQKDYTGWIRLNVTEAVLSWKQHPAKNYGIKITAQDSTERDIPTELIFNPSSCENDTSDISPVLPILTIFNDTSNLGSAANNNTSYPFLDVVAVRPITNIIVVDEVGDNGESGVNEADGTPDAAEPDAELPTLPLRRRRHARKNTQRNTVVE